MLGYGIYLSDFEEEEETVEDQGYASHEPWSPAATTLITPTASSFARDICLQSQSSISSSGTIDPSVFRKAPRPHYFNPGFGNLPVNVDDGSKLQLAPSEGSSIKDNLDSDDPSDSESIIDVEPSSPSLHPSQHLPTEVYSEGESELVESPLVDMEDEPSDEMKVIIPKEEPDVGRSVSERVKRTQRTRSVQRDPSFSPSPPASSDKRTPSSPDLTDHDSTTDASGVSSVRVSRPRKKAKGRARAKVVHGANRPEQNKRAQKKYRDKRKDIAALNENTLQRIFGEVLNDLPGLSKTAILAKLRENARQWIEDVRALDPVIAAKVEADM